MSTSPTESSAETTAEAVTAIYQTLAEREPVTFTVTELCRLLRLAPTAVPVLADSGDIVVTLPPASPGYCPALDDVRIVAMRRNLTADTGLLTALRKEHPPERRDSHYRRITALGGVLRVLGR